MGAQNDLFAFMMFTICSCHALSKQNDDQTLLSLPRIKMLMLDFIAVFVAKDYPERSAFELVRAVTAVDSMLYRDVLMHCILISDSQGVY